MSSTSPSPSSDALGESLGFVRTLALIHGLLAAFVWLGGAVAWVLAGAFLLTSAPVAPGARVVGLGIIGVAGALDAVPCALLIWCVRDPERAVWLKLVLGVSAVALLARGLTAFVMGLWMFAGFLALWAVAEVGAMVATVVAPNLRGEEDAEG